MAYSIAAFVTYDWCRRLTASFVVHYAKKRDKSIGHQFIVKVRSRRWALPRTCICARVHVAGSYISCVVSC